MLAPQAGQGTLGLPRLLLRERVVVLLAVGGITLIAWLYLLTLGEGMAMSMPAMAGAMPMAMPWTATVFALTFAMWVVMMLGMMLPSAAPMILTFVAMNRRKRSSGEGVVPSLVFVLGYVIVWGGFSLAATVLQFALDRIGLLSQMLTATSTLLSGALFLLAGAYQLTPAKQACLRHCRSPFAFLFNHWRDGAAGALRMGIEHGAWCLGCCWLLMALLFVVGVMNLLFVAALTLFVLAEKLLPGGVWIARGSGVAMAAYGGWLILHGVAA